MSSDLMTRVKDKFVTVDGFAKGENAPAFFGCLGPNLQRWIDTEQAGHRRDRVPPRQLAPTQAAQAQMDTVPAA